MFQQILSCFNRITSNHIIFFIVWHSPSNIKNRRCSVWMYLITIIMGLQFPEKKQIGRGCWRRYGISRVIEEIVYSVYMPNTMKNLKTTHGWCEWHALTLLSTWIISSSLPWLSGMVSRMCMCILFKQHVNKNY